LTLTSGDKVSAFSLIKDFEVPIDRDEILAGGRTLFLFYLFDFSGSAEEGG
jgi:hypothetical protein